MAGRELDALVAEKVMGIAVNRFGEVIQPGMGVGMPRRYSTDIASAWGVVEKMQADGWFFKVEDGALHTCWYADFIISEPGRPPKGPRRTQADTAPLAICLAALKAVGE